MIFDQLPHLMGVQNRDGVCGCLKCQKDRREQSAPADLHEALASFYRYFRYACELCGNKRCPHHTNHRLPCTNSNEPGQQGSAY